MMVLQLLTSGLLCVVGILLIAVHVCVLWRYSRRDDHLISSAIRSTGSVSVSVDDGGLELERGRRALRSADFEKLPRFQYSKVEDGEEAEKKGGGSATECAVCLEGFKVGDECRLLPICNHRFHVCCIDSWLLKTPTCPVCRTWPVPV